MEGALGHARKDSNHRVNSTFLVHFGVFNDVDAVGGEGATEKGVNKVHLNDHVDEVEHLAEDKVKEVAVVVSGRWGQGLIKGQMSKRRAISQNSKLPNSPQVRLEVLQKQ